MLDAERNITFIHIPRNAGTSVKLALGYKNLKGSSKHLPYYAYLGYWHHKVNQREFPFHAEGHKALRVTNPPSAQYVSDFNKSHKFAIVRNPWARVFSAWEYDNKMLDSDYKDLVANPYSKSSRAWVDRRRKFINNYRKANGSSFKDFIDNLSHTWFGEDGQRAYVNVNQEKLPYKGFFPYHWIRWHGHSQCTFVHGPDNKLMVDSILRAEDLDNDWPKLMEQVKLDVTLPSVNVDSKESYQQYYTEEAMVDAVARRYIHDVNIFDYTFM